MIAQIYYLPMSQDEYQEFIENHKEGFVDEVVVPKHGKLLNTLKVEDDILLSLMSTPKTEITNNRNTISLTNMLISSKQALGPIVMETIIDTDNEDVYASNCILIKWAFYHKFKSTLMHYFSKYQTLRKCIGSLIYGYINKPGYTDMIEFVIDKYDYDIHKDNDRLIQTAALSKNYHLTKYLIEDKNCLIPPNVYNIYMKCGKNQTKLIWELIKNNADKVDIR